MRSRLRFKPISIAILGAALMVSSGAQAQNTSTSPAPGTPAKAAGGEDQYPDLIEIDPFGGISLYGDSVRGLTTHIADGGVGGIRIGVNPSKYVGLELWADYANGNVEFRTPSAPGLPAYGFGNKIYNFGLNPVFNFTPRGSKVQPYLTVGVGGTQWSPTSTAETFARSAATNATFHSGQLNDNLQVTLNYGGGVKFHFTDHLGMRFDARGLWSRNPTFDLPNYPDGGIYIPAKNKINGLQATAGLVFYFGTTKCPPMPAPPPPPAPLNPGTITGAEGTICQGKPVTLHSNASGATGHTLSYAWTVNGSPAGSNSPDLSYTANNTGTFNVQVTVTDTAPPPPPMVKPPKFPVRCWIQPATPPPVAPVTATASFTISTAAPTITSVTADPTTLACAANATGAHSSNLTVAATASACGGNLTYKWTVSEGSVSNDSAANAMFDSSTVNFEGGAQGQTKSITATVTVTDESGQTASGTTTVSVNCAPQFVRLDDVVFAKNNARVNNCGKRILIDEASTQATTGNYDIVLVGHRDNDESATTAATGRGKRRVAGHALDEQRVINAAGVLSGGGATCAHFDPSHIRVDWVGSDQTSEARPGLCGTSNLAAQKERKGSTVSSGDKNRRVEVYLVPRGSNTLPPAVKNVKPLPSSEVKAVGCPR